MSLSLMQVYARRISLAKELVPGLALTFLGLYIIALPFALNALALSHEELSPTFWEYFGGTLVGGLPLIGPGLLFVVAGLLSVWRKITGYCKGPRKPNSGGDF